jgi:hypothetical protein
MAVGQMPFPTPCPLFLHLHRKAYRLGKFLQDVNKIRKLELSGQQQYLELAALTGDGIYYFLDQVTWCAGNAGSPPSPVYKCLLYMSVVAVIPSARAFCSVADGCCSVSEGGYGV